MTASTIQPSFSIGEVAPSLFGRTDLARFHAGASTMRNMFCSYKGGAYSRAGTSFVGFSKQTGRNFPPRLVTFQFSINQGLALEFGNFYMRVVSNGSFILETPITITDATQSDPCVIIAAALGLSSATPDESGVTVSYVPGELITLAGGTFVEPAVVSVTDTKLLSLALNEPGAGIYEPGDTITLAGGTQTTPAVVAVVTTQVISATVASAGTTGTPGTALVDGTTGTGTKFQANVTIDGGGTISAVNSITVAGSYTANPTDPTAEPVTGGGLSGAKLNLVMGVLTVAIFNSGVFTANAPGGVFTQASTSGTGTGATFNLGMFGPNSVLVDNPGVYTVFPANPVAQGSSTGFGIGVVFNCVTAGVSSFNDGDWVYIQDVQGMTQLNGETYVIGNTAPNTFALFDVYGNPVDSSAFGAYTGGGTVARVYTQATPYAEADLQYLKWTQSADVMSICCVNQETQNEYAPQDLVRYSDTNWVFQPLIAAPSVDPPSSASGVASAAGAIDYQYAVTAVASDGTESVASPIAAINSAVNIAATAGSITLTWNAVFGVNEYNIYKATPGYNTAPPVGSLFGYAGSAFGTQFIDSNIVADFNQVPPKHKDPFAQGQVISVTPTAGGSGYASISVTINTSTGSGAVLQGVIVSGALAAVLVIDSGKNYKSTDTITISGTGIGGGGSGATADAAVTVDGAVGPISVTAPGTGYVSPVVTISGDGFGATAVAIKDVSGAITAIYMDNPGTGYTAATVAITDSGASGTGAAATLQVGPDGGTYPSVVAYFQQRRGYASSLNNPDTYWFSQPGSFTNFDSRIPTIDSDAITGSPWSTQVNGIQFMVPMPGGLVVLTGLQAWQLTGNGGSSLNPQPIGPSTQQAQPQAYNGCSATVPPIRIDYEIIYVQAKGSVYRDLSYQFYTNIYTGTDLTLNSSQLFTGYTIREHAWCEEPYKIIWSVRDDGTMLSLTFLKPEQVAGWGRSDTQGLFKSVCSVTEPPVDALYLAAQRFPGANTCYTIERMNDRIWSSVEDCWCVDCGLSLAQPTPNASITADTATGPGICSGVTSLVGGSGYSSSTTASVVDDNGKGPGTGAVAVLTIVGGVITAVSFVPGGTNYIRPALVINDPSNTGRGASARVTLDSTINFRSGSAIFSPGDVGKVIRMGGGTATLTAYMATDHMVGQLTQPIVDIIPNTKTDANPGGVPQQQSAGNWTMTMPVTSVSGLRFHAGATVTGLCDGTVIPPTVVPDSGIISLPIAGTAVVVGLGFQAQLQSMYLDTGEPTIQGQRKKVAASTARIESSRGLKIGANQPDGSTLSPPQISPTWTNLVPVEDKGLPPYNSTVIPLYTGDVRIPLPGGYNTKGQVCLQQDYPLPMQVLAMIDEVLPGDTTQLKDPEPKGRSK